MYYAKSFLLPLSGLVLVMGSVPAFADNVAPTSPTSSAATQGSASSAPASSGMSPYQLKLQYAGEAWDNTSGGLKTGAVYMQNLDAQLRIDTDKAFGWTGGKAVFEGYYEGSHSIANQLTGATLDSPSPIDAYGATRIALYQAYYDQNLGNTDLLFGVWDPQSEFANTAQQNLFLNRNFTWNSALDLSGATFNYAGNYPWTTVAFRARQDITDEWTVQGAILNGMKDNAKDLGVTDFQFRGDNGVTGIAEVNYTPKARTKLYAGYWGFTGKQKAYNQYTDDGSSISVYGSNGGYIGGGTRLYTQEGKRGLDGFINLGFADPTENEITRSLNVGLTYTGLFDLRPNDATGIAVNYENSSDPYRKDQLAQGNNPAHYEADVELTYHAKVNDWLKVQPDLQYIINPNMGLNPNTGANTKNAFVVGVHFEIGHWFGL